VWQFKRRFEFPAGQVLSRGLLWRDCPALTESVEEGKMLIRELVHQALTTGYLSVMAENKLRSLLQSKYEHEDLCAFMQLQKAAMEGLVRQESRDRIQACD
jgi:hypothetical protein